MLQNIIPPWFPSGGFDPEFEGTVVGVGFQRWRWFAVSGEDVGSSKQPIITPASKLSGFKSFTIF